MAKEPGRRPPVRTDQMRIRVRVVYSPAHSDPPLRHVFVYFVRIENIGNDTAQLFWRHWKIHDAGGEVQEVEGEGVVGESPVLAPGAVHEYHSFCALKGPQGHMEGFYHFRQNDGSLFRAPIPRFHLYVPGDGISS